MDLGEEIREVEAPAPVEAPVETEVTEEVEA